MKLIDPDTNQEYEFEKFKGQDPSVLHWGTLKPVDSWPKFPDTYWRLDQEGKVYKDCWEDTEEEKQSKDFTGIYKSYEQAEMAADRIRSLQEAEAIYFGDDPTGKAVINLHLPKKYLKSWQALERSE